MIQKCMSICIYTYIYKYLQPFNVGPSVNEACIWRWEWQFDSEACPPSGKPFQLGGIQKDLLSN